MKFVFDNAYVQLNAVDLSDHVESVTLQLGSDEVEKTSMGDDTHLFIPGLKDWTIEITFRQDFAAASVDDTLYGLWGSTFTVNLNPEGSTTAADNPRYSATGFWPSYSPMGGSVGEIASAPVTIRPNSAMSRSTS